MLKFFLPAGPVNPDEAHESHVSGTTSSKWLLAKEASLVIQGATPTFVINAETTTDPSFISSTLSISIAGIILLSWLLFFTSINSRKPYLKVK
jgi:hypothetical protein